jgi:hypothetical protein
MDEEDEREKKKKNYLVSETKQNRWRNIKTHMIMFTVVVYEINWVEPIYSFIDNFMFNYKV